MMSDYKEKVFQQYSSGREDGRSAWSRSQSLEFHYTKKTMEEYINPTSRVLEIGCATGYYALHFAERCREYVGIDLFPPHIELFNQKITDKKLTNVSCRVGDALHLDEIEDDSFDVVCCFGPMYHLPPDERERVMAECRRVCKPGGIIAFAFINKIGVYVGACVDRQLSSVYPNRQTNDYVLRQGTDDVKPGTFYFTMPEEIEAAARRQGLVKLRFMGTDSFITMSIVDKMEEETFAAYLELHDEMVRHESCVGMSNHALLICGKARKAE